MQKPHTHKAKQLSSSPEEYYKDDKYRSDYATCECGYNYHEWYCPESPSGLCGYEKSSYACDYCGMPDERK